jgi:probable phosphoglycerate mutase
MTDDHDRQAQGHATPAAEPGDDPFLSLKSGSTEVYLIRHADALPSAEEVTDGGYDAQALSELGRRQAEALGERMRAVPLAAVYSSPIGRARETALAVAERAGLEVTIEHDLREVALGHIGPDADEAMPAEERSRLLRERLREIAVVAVTTGKWSSIPGSEPSFALRARVTTTVDRLAGQYPGQRIAVVSHGGAINAYLAAILGIERDYFFPAANTSISVVRVQGDRHMLLTLNDIGHLRESGLIDWK